jgi:hypothetical protein
MLLTDERADAERDYEVGGVSADGDIVGPDGATVRKR